jgi:hypothetical protein
MAPDSGTATTTGWGWGVTYSTYATTGDSVFWSSSNYPTYATTGGSVFWSSSNYPALPVPEVELLPATKEERHRRAMREYLRSHAPLEDASRRPVVKIRTMCDPLRHHRLRQFRRTPRRSGVASVACAQVSRR